mgnify:CR=1 FL=1
MMGFLSSLLPNLLNFTGALSAKNPRTTAWGTIGLGVAGVLGYAPDQVRGALMAVANFFANLAGMIPG